MFKIVLQMFCVRLYLYILFLPAVTSLYFTTKDCHPGDGLTSAGSYSVFTDTSESYVPCRAESDLSLPRDVTYVIDVEFQIVDDSTPGIIYNVQDDNNYEVLLFRANDFDCLRFGSFRNSMYTERNSAYCDLQIEGEVWFQVSMEVDSSSIVVQINGQTVPSQPTVIVQRPTAGLIHGLGYKDRCSPSCEFNFRSLKLSPDTAPEYYSSERDTLNSPSGITDHLYLQRIEFHTLGRIPGTFCFVAFYHEYINLGPSTIYIQEDEIHSQGEVKIYSTAAVRLDIYYYSSTMNPSVNGYSIKYHVFACGIPENDLSFICDNGQHVDLHSDFHRSTMFESDASNYINDDTLPMHWYRFSSCAGDKIPTVNPGTQDVCGTRDPIWVKQTNTDPTPDGIYSQEACLYQGENSNCNTNWTVPVFTCNSDYLLYYLVPTPEYSAYCAGTEIECDASKNLTSIHGDGCSPCREAHFPILTTAPSIEDWIPAAGHSYELPCVVHNPDSRVDIEFEIEWWVDYGTHREFLQRFDLAHYTQVTLSSTSIEKMHLQNHIFCKARGKYVGGELMGPWAESKLWFIGIQIDEYSENMEISTAENSKGYLRYSFTVPINCMGDVCLDETDAQCYTEVYSVTTTRGLNKLPCENSLFLESVPIHQIGCSNRVPCNKWSGLDNIKTFIISAQDTKQQARPTHTHNTYLITKDNRDMWNNLVVQTQLTTIPDDDLGGSGKKECKSRNDPHLTTINQCGYEVHVDGEHVLYKSTPEDEPDMNVLVTAKYARCSSSGTVRCNGAVGIRVKDEAIVISPADLIYMGPGYGEDGFKLSTTDDGLTYVATLPRGEVVTAFIYSGHRLNVHVEAVNDKQSNSYGNGLCGKIRPGWNPTIGKSDLADRAGARYEIPCNNKERVPDFSNKWLTETDEEIIDKDTIELKNITKSIDTYQCTVYDINDFLVADDWSFERRLVAEQCIRHSQDNMMNDLRNDALKNNFNHGYRGVDKQNQHSSSEPLVDENTFEEWTEEEALQHCQNYIGGSSIGTSCNQIDKEEVDIAISECALDIMLSGGTTWADGTLSSLQKLCISSLYRNLSIWEFEQNGNETIFKPPSDVTENLCPNNCSNQGYCEDASCVCDAGFIGFDCGLHTETPPQLNSVSEGGICYPDTCDKIKVQGLQFVDAETLTCHFESKGTVTATTAVMWTFNTVFCTLPPIEPTSKGYTQYSLKVSNDGVHTSSALEVYVVDADCITCQQVDQTNVKCEIQGTTCFIGGRCVTEGEISPTNVCQFCDPGEAQDTWAKGQLAGCGNNDGLSSLHIGLISMACVVAVIALVALTAFIRIRVKSNKVSPQDDTEITSRAEIATHKDNP